MQHARGRQRTQKGYLQWSAGVVSREDRRRSIRVERIADIGPSGLPGRDPTDYFNSVVGAVRAASSELADLPKVFDAKGGGA